MAYLAKKGYVSRNRTDFVIITEPLNHDRVCLGHRGVWWFQVTLEGRIAHGSMPFLGVSAIDKMSKLLNHVAEDLQPALAQRRSAMPVEPPEARLATLNVNSVHGGQPEEGPHTPCVADRCTAIFDRRFLIEEHFSDVRREVAELLERLRRDDPLFRYKMDDLMTVFPVQSRADSPLVGSLSESIEQVVGKRPAYIASPGTYDQKHVMRIGGIEQCVAYGPGRLELSHLPDEYCVEDELISATKVMALSTLQLVGTADA